MTLVNAGPDQFYIPASRNAFIKKVQAGLTHAKIVAIEGQQGIGKTILIEEVLTQTLPDGNKCYLTAARSINDIQIRSRIIEQLFGNVLFDPEMPILTSFIEFNNSSDMLIAIDNAHFLSGKIIGELLQLCSESKNLGIQLSIVMALDKTIASTLINVKSGLVEILPVPLLTKQESYQLLAEYVIDIPAQTSPRIKRWIENSAGLPIQLLAYNDVNAGKVSDSEPFNIKLWASILVTCSLLLALGIYLYRMGIISEQEQALMTNTSLNKTSGVVKPWQNVTESNSALEKQNAISTKERSELLVADKKMAQVVIRPTASSELIFSELMSQKSKVSFGNEKVAENPTTDMILAELTKKPESVDNNLINEITTTTAEIDTDTSETSQKEQQITDIGNESNLTETPISMDFFLDLEDAQSELEKPESKKQVQTELNESSLVENTALDSDKIQVPDISRIDQEPTLEELIQDDIISVAKEQPSAEDPGKPYTIDNQIFMSLPADHFVLQLTAVSSEAVLAQYLESAPYEKDKLRIYMVKRNYTDWLVVTYGLFETIELARQTAASIAPNAWAKSISVIQQQILAFDDAQSAQ